MEQRFPLKRLHSYPHLLPEDTEIWNGFLDAPHPDLLDVEYDLRIGPPTFDVDDVDPITRKLALALNRRRIDVVIHGVTTIYVVEIKPRAGLNAFGQALGYSWLYRQEINPPNIVQPVVMTDEIIPGMADLYKAFGVALWIVDLSRQSSAEND